MLKGWHFLKGNARNDLAGYCFNGTRIAFLLIESIYNHIFLRGLMWRLTAGSQLQLGPIPSPGAERSPQRSPRIPFLLQHVT